MCASEFPDKVLRVNFHCHWRNCMWNEQKVHSASLAGNSIQLKCGYTELQILYLIYYFNVRSAILFDINLLVQADPAIRNWNSVK